MQVFRFTPRSVLPRFTLHVIIIIDYRLCILQASGVRNSSRIPEWSSSKMAAVTYGLKVCHEQLQMSTARYSNKTQRKLQSVPQTMIQAVKRGYWQLLSLQSRNIRKDVKKSTVTSTAVPYLSPSVSNSSADPKP